LWVKGGVFFLFFFYLWQRFFSGPIFAIWRQKKMKLEFIYFSEFFRFFLKCKNFRRKNRKFGEFFLKKIAKLVEFTLLKKVPIFPFSVEKNEKKNLK
jgi:hypothetical protein